MMTIVKYLISLIKHLDRFFLNLLPYLILWSYSTMPFIYGTSLYGQAFHITIEHSLPPNNSSTLPNISDCLLLPTIYPEYIYFFYQIRLGQTFIKLYVLDTFKTTFENCFYTVSFYFTLQSK